MKIIFGIILTAAIMAVADGVTNVVTNAKGVTNSFTRGGVSFARRGALTSSDFVVTDAQVITEGRVAEIATNTARAVINSVWDEKLGVTWEARMYDGNLYYIAVTNENVTEVKQ